MNAKLKLLFAAAVVVSAVGVVLAAQDKYSLKITNGLAFSEFRRYERWETISVSYNGGVLAAILGNPRMIEAYKEGASGNGKPFPDGAKMVKIHWHSKENKTYPGGPIIPTALQDIDLMVKDSKRFADSGGWGYGAFEYDDASKAFRPATESDQPPQAHDAKCGFACHTVVKSRDYVFTDYPNR